MEQKILLTEVGERLLLEKLESKAWSGTLDAFILYVLYEYGPLTSVEIMYKLWDRDPSFKQKYQPSAIELVIERLNKKAYVMRDFSSFKSGEVVLPPIQTKIELSRFGKPSRFELARSRSLAVGNVPTSIPTNPSEYETWVNENLKTNVSGLMGMNRKGKVPSLCPICNGVIIVPSNTTHTNCSVCDEIVEVVNPLHLLESIGGSDVVYTDPSRYEYISSSKGEGNEGPSWSDLEKIQKDKWDEDKIY